MPGQSDLPLSHVQRNQERSGVLDMNASEERLRALEAKNLGKMAPKCGFAAQAESGVATLNSAVFDCGCCSLNE